MAQTGNLRPFSETALLQAIVSTVVNGIIVIDEHGRIELFNPAAELIFGYSAQEMLGQKINVLMPEPQRSEHDGYIQRYLRSGTPRVIGIGREVAARRRDGSIFPMDLAVSEMRVGNDRKFVGITTDISERKAGEQMLIEAKEQAEESNRLKSEFLNVMSHELRTPLTVMLGNTPLLSDLRDLPEPEEIAEIAQDIEDAGQHLLTLINDLLDISKIEAGKMPLYYKTFSASELVCDVVGNVRVLAKEKGLTLETDVQNVEIYADPVRLKQILLNLLGNAVKFTEKGRIRVSVAQEGRNAYFSIADTGCGMKPEDLDVIFDVFRQVDSSATRRAGGTGLGLAISKKLIDLHGGQLSVQSKVGRGSEFTFTLPVEGSDADENFNRR